MCRIYVYLLFLAPLAAEWQSSAIIPPPPPPAISRFLPSFFHSFLDYGVRNYGIHRIAAELDAIWLPKSTSTTTIVLQFKCRFFPIQIFSAHNFTFSFVR